MRKYAVIFGIVAGILCIVTGVVIWASVNFYNRPQALSLNLATETVELPTIIPDSSISTEVVQPSNMTPTVIPTQVSQDCNQTGSWSILFLGRSIHQTPAQMIRLVKLDFDQKTAVIYDLPPDLVVETPGMIQEYMIQKSRLQDIYTAIVTADGESKATDYKATRATAQAVLDNFGFAAEYYLTVKEDYVNEAVDVIGGRDVVLSQGFLIPDYAKDSSVVLTTNLNLEQIEALSCLTRLIPLENIMIELPNSDQIVVLEDGSMVMKDPSDFVNQILTLFKVP